MTFRTFHNFSKLSGYSMPTQKSYLFIILVFFFLMINSNTYLSKNINTSVGRDKIEETMLRATRYFADNIAYNGGYLWTYTSDLSRRWGELEALPTMVWVQGSGTVEMGNTFLDAYEITNNEYYYEQAAKAAHSLIQGQLDCGGWNYLIDFGGEESIKEWYNTIGKSAWRLEEFHHYHGNATFDDGATAGAASYLLRFYLVKEDQKVKYSLDKATNFILESQYYEGSWPQRYPIKNEFYIDGKHDYSTYHTFNDGVIVNNLIFLISSYKVFNDDKLLDPIYKAMNFFIKSLYSNPQSGWALQYDLELKPATARSYEPASLDPQLSYRNCEMLLKFYQMTGDEKYLEVIPDVINWIETVTIKKLDNNLIAVPKFVEVGTNKALYVHRRGENSCYGEYYVDYETGNDIIHYPSKRYLNLRYLKNEYERIRLSKVDFVEGRIFIPGLKENSADQEKLKAISEFFSISQYRRDRDNSNNKEFVKRIISELDYNGRWLESEVYISNPYKGIPENGNQFPTKYSNTYVGNEYDTSPYPNDTDSKYISTATYIRNMKTLVRYLKTLE